MIKMDEDGKLTYKGKVVVEHVHSAVEDTVKITLTYKTYSSGDWIVPISYLAFGLKEIEPMPKPAVLTIETSENDIAEEFEVLRLLTEKIVKRDGHIWHFHKEDADPWPSALHGHDNDKGLVIDAITGNIFDKATRKKCNRLKRKKLAEIQIILCSSDSLRKLATTHLGLELINY